MPKIYDTDNPWQIASKIYEGFEIGMSCRVSGFVEIEEKGTVIAKGEAVLDQLRIMDDADNCRDHRGARVRKVRIKENAIGGPIAQKIFCWDKVMNDGEPKYTIWRFQ
jgi:hypothetical protein